MAKEFKICRRVNGVPTLVEIVKSDRETKLAALCDWFTANNIGCADREPYLCFIYRR
jgi:hypothetical protein